MDQISRETIIQKSFSDPSASELLGLLDRARIPEHVAVIMDGNGRWAKKRNQSRLSGHKAGVAAVRDLIVSANDLGIKYLTIYSFSTENWNRPKEEVKGLMTLFAEVLAKEIRGLDKEGVRVKILGDLKALPERTRKTFADGAAKTEANAGMTLAIAVNYGSRKEMLDATRSIAADVMDGRLAPEDIDEELFSHRLYTREMPDPDLLIRTSGEMRLSNFLLWQVAYTELWITEKFWPDFTRYDLLQALVDYQMRNRRFGGSE